MLVEDDCSLTGGEVNTLPLRENVKIRSVVTPTAHSADV